MHIPTVIAIPTAALALCLPSPPAIAATFQLTSASNYFYRILDGGPSVGPTPITIDVFEKITLNGAIAGVELVLDSAAVTVGGWARGTSSNRASFDMPSDGAVGLGLLIAPAGEAPGAVVDVYVHSKAFIGTDFNTRVDNYVDFSPTWSVVGCVGVPGGEDPHVGSAFRRIYKGDTESHVWFRETCQYSVEVGSTVELWSKGDVVRLDDQIADSRLQVSFSPDPPEDPPVAEPYVPALTAGPAIVLVAALLLTPIALARLHRSPA